MPRGAGTSLSGGAIPQEDAIVVGLSKMNRILEINLADRYARVEAGVTNLAISEAVAPDGFFYAPDPSSQLACTIGGNIGMNSGGAHCLKYGVTTNNLLGVRLVTLDGEIVDFGGAAIRRRRARPARPRLRLRGPARHRHRGDRAPAARRRGRAAGAVRLRFGRGRRANASPRSSAPASCRWRWNIWTSWRSRSARTSPTPAIRSTSRRC